MSIVSALFGEPARPKPEVELGYTVLLSDGDPLDEDTLRGAVQAYDAAMGRRDRPRRRRAG